MFYEVIQLRKGGQRLRPEDWPAPEFGKMVMVTWRPGETTLGRTARVASLYQPAGLMERCAMLLIEPKITHLPLDGEVWLGTQLKNTDQGIKEIEQAWLVRPRAKDGQPLPRFDVDRWMRISRAAGDVPQPPVGKGWIKPGSARR